MDTLLLSRIQFAVTIGFHYIYPPLSIGLGIILVVMEGLYLKTRDLHYLNMAKFWKPKRMRLSRSPPYRSVRWLVKGDKNSEIR